MKKVYSLTPTWRIIVVLMVAGSVILFLSHKTGNANTDVLTESEHESDEPGTDAQGAAEYELMISRDLKTGQIPVGIRQAELAEAQGVYMRQMNERVFANTYSFQGPDNLGGRTRTIVYDVRYNGTSNQTILAGGISGGVYKSTDNGATWVRKSPLNNLFSVTSIAQDPRPGFQDTWYYGTGEAIGNSTSGSGSFYLGNGVYKSIDDGETWNRLANSDGGVLESFDNVADLITKVAVNPTNGDVYAGGVCTVLRSQDGGTTWAAVISGAASTSTQTTDIAITSTGLVYVAFSGTCPNTVDGVWNSPTGNAGTYTRIAGTGAATNPAGWNARNAYGRVVLAITPSNQNLVYAMYYDNINNGCPAATKEAEFYKWDQSVTTWTDLSANLPDEAGCSVGNDPFAVQGGYDMVVVVKTDDPNTVFIGGTNIYRSTDGFTSTANTTRIGGYLSPAGYTLYTNSHSDIHSLVIQPGASTIMLAGDDGGIQRTADNTAVSVAWTEIDQGYGTYQYYNVAIDPRSGNTKVIGGAQDNGTTRNVGGAGTSFEMVLSGDGVSVGLSDVIAGNTFEYCGSQSGNIARRNSTSLPNFSTNIRPAAAVNPGLFVTEFRLDPDNSDLIYYASDSSLYRNLSASAATTGNWTLLTGVGPTVKTGNQITALATTRGTYNAVTASLFIGASNGKVYRLDDPENVAAATAPVDITGAIAGGFISSIAVNPRNDDTVIVTVSNYGSVGVWWTGNANSATPTWSNVEGNLTLPSFRSSAIAITNLGAEYFVGTSAGLFKTQINGASPGTTTWTQEGASQLGNAVVDALVLRPVDNTLLVGTHGVGMWTTTLALAGLPVTFRSFTGVPEKLDNLLSWVVDNEQNNKGFELQRRYVTDNDYTTVGFIKGKNGQGVNIYSFKDQSIDLGKEVCLYRLKQIDLDNNFTYSSVITIKRTVSAKMLEYISVNGNSMFIRINNANNSQTLLINFYDAAGKLVKKINTQYQTQQIDISSLSRGVYIVEVVGSNNQKVIQKIMR